LFNFKGSDAFSNRSVFIWLTKNGYIIIRLNYPGGREVNFLAFELNTNGLGT
jgi:hypothetical protein